MSDYLGVIKKENKPKLESIADDIKARQDKHFFWPSGTQVYCGTQGSGKTISAVRHLLRIKERYPKAIVVSNLNLSGAQPLIFGNKNELQLAVDEVLTNPDDKYIRFSDMTELELALVGVNNGKYGVIYLIDEIHTYFNALDSKNIPMFVFTEISQQRKQRKLIVGTSQLFLRMAKPFREQCDSVIMCNTHFGILTTQRAYDGMTLTQDYDGKLQGKMKKRGWFFHNRKIRNAFDTFQKVVSGAEQYDQSQNIAIQVKGKRKKLMIS